MNAKGASGADGSAPGTAPSAESSLRAELQRYRAERRANERTLHAMGQPLTALLCMLEIGRIQGDRDSLARAVNAGLRESERLAQLVKDMQLQSQRLSLDHEGESAQE